MTRVAIAVGLVGCGGGEPISGDITMTYGSDRPEMVVGSVVQHQDSDDMLIQIGTDDVDCDTYLDVFLDFDLPKGHFVYFSVPKAPGTYSDGSVSVLRSKSRDISINSSSGDVTIDAIEPRVTGSVTFTTNDEDVGEIAVSGTFDVIRCF